MRKIMILAAACAITGLGSAAASDPASEGKLQSAILSTGGGESDASLTLARWGRYTCIARSRIAYGYWTSPYLAVARRRALVQCALRTPRGYACVITRCR
jgi:hypothetical protein